MADDIHKIEYPEDPERCKFVNSQGQCFNKGLKMSDGKILDFCGAHGGHRQEAVAQRADLRNYRLTKFHAELQRHAASPHIKGLRDEIGILRMCLEERLNQCMDTHDLILQSGPINDTIIKIEKLVASCHNLEGSMGQLLDRQAIIQFAQEMISIIGDEITDAAIIDRITAKMMSRLEDGGLNEGV